MYAQEYKLIYTVLIHVKNHVNFYHKLQEIK